MKKKNYLENDFEDLEERYNRQYSYLVKRFQNCIRTVFDITPPLLMAIDKHKETITPIEKYIVFIGKTLLNYEKECQLDTDYDNDYVDFQWLNYDRDGEPKQAGKIDLLYSANPFDIDGGDISYIYIGYNNGKFKAFLNLKIPEPKYMFNAKTKLN